MQISEQLIFDPIAHRYYFGGAPVPNVTAVLEGAGLINYDFLGERREFYLARGRAVHLATQSDDRNGLAEDSVNPEVLGYLHAWRGFKRDYGFTPHLIEHKVFHTQFKYAGTVDRFGSIRGGTKIIIDIKSGIAPDAVRYQLAAYAGCLRHPRTRLRWCVELHADDGYRVIPFETSDYQRDFKEFLAALNTFRNKEELWFPR
jgi:hypothetical protein